MKQITRKQFFKSLTSGLLALGVVAMGKSVEKLKCIVCLKPDCEHTITKKIADSAAQWEVTASHNKNDGVWSDISDHIIDINTSKQVSRKELYDRLAGRIYDRPT